MSTVSGAYFKSLMDGCIVNGADSNALHELVQGGAAAFDNPKSRFPCEDFINVLNTAVSLTGDQSLGVKAGLIMKPGSIMDLGNALMVCDNLVEAMHLNHRYQPLVQQFGSTKLEITSAGAELSWSPKYQSIERHRYFVEYIYARYIAIGRWLIFDQTPSNISMTFRHKPPKDTALYKHVFGENLSFDADCDLLIFKSEIAQTPLVTANHAVKTIIIERLDKQLTDFEGCDNISVRVSQHIHSVLPKGRPSLLDISRLMGMSERTLRRRLADEDMNFRELLEKVRKASCAIYMQQEDLSFAQIAQTLGFSDQSAFSRAFKDWHGMTPRAYQSQQKPQV